MQVWSDGRELALPIVVVFWNFDNMGLRFFGEGGINGEGDVCVDLYHGGRKQMTN